MSEAHPGPEPTPERTRRRREPAFPEDRLVVTSWPDPVLDQLGHDPRSGYVERFWLPVLGPSCLLLLRRLAADLERQPGGYTLDTAVWARELGIGMKGGRNGPFWRAVDRTSRFGAARRNGPRLAVRRRLPPLSSRQVSRLPVTLRSAHAEWADARLDRPRRATITRWSDRNGTDVDPDLALPAEVDPPFPDAA